MIIQPVLHFRGTSKLRVSLISILLLFIFAHIVTINYPYLMEDEAIYRVLGSLHKLSLDAGFVWNVFSGAVSGLDASNYRYICALESLIVTGSIIYIFAQTELLNVGILAAIIFVGNVWFLCELKGNKFFVGQF